MRICFINNLYGERARGGAERVVVGEAAELQRAGYDIAVISSCRKGDEVVETRDGVSTYLVSSHNLCWYGDLGKYGAVARLFWHFVDMGNIFSASRLRRIIKEINPDVVHTHNIMGLGFLLPRVLKRMRIRHVHTVHDVQLLHPSGLMNDMVSVGFFQQIYITMLRWIVGSPDVVVFPSEFSRALHDRFGFFSASKNVVLRNPVENNQGSRSIEQRSPYFLCVGQLEPHKGIRELLTAWQGWSDRGNAMLHIVGGGSLEEEVRSAVGRDSSICFYGKKTSQELHALYNKATYLVFPSVVIENAPAVIGESFSSGVPVIASSVGGVPELVREGKTGFLCEPGSVESLLFGFERARTSTRWQEMSEHVRRVADEMSVAKHCKRLMELYQIKI